jgi:putative transposase
MKALGLQGVSCYKYVRTIIRQTGVPPNRNLVTCDLSDNGSNEPWVADIIFISTWTGFLYLIVVMDAWGRRVTGWYMADHLRTELGLAANEMTIRQRRPQCVIHHSDAGSQYTSLTFGKRCREIGVAL